MKLFAIEAMMIVLFSATGHSQQNKGPPTTRTEQEMKEDKEFDKAYRDAMKRSAISQEQPAKADPWQIVRPPGTNDAKKRQSGRQRAGGSKGGKLRAARYGDPTVARIFQPVSVGMGSQKRCPALSQPARE